jgi:surface antigen
MYKAISAAALAAVLVAGCAYDDGGRYGDRGGPPPDGRYAGGGDYRYDGCRDNAAAGTVIGGVAGGVIGNQFGSGGGRAAATVGGVILGAIAGNAIARDACRNDRADAYYYNQSYYDAFEQPRYGQRYEWRNRYNGNYGYITPRRGFRDGRGECREFTQQIYVDGYRTEEAVGVACRQRDGSWRIVD